MQHTVSAHCTVYTHMTQRWLNYDDDDDHDDGDDDNNDGGGDDDDDVRR